MACVWRRDDEWGKVTRARLLSWIHGVFLLRLFRKLIDRSRNVGLHSGSYVCNVHLIPQKSFLKKLFRRHRRRALTRAGMVCVRGRNRMPLMGWVRRES